MRAFQWQQQIPTLWNRSDLNKLQINHTRRGQSTYYPSISAADIDEAARPGLQHSEDVLHLGACRGHKRQADFSQCWGDKRRSHRVKGDQRPSKHPRNNNTKSAPALWLLRLTRKLSTLRCVGEKLLLSHDAATDTTPPLARLAKLVLSPNVKCQESMSSWALTRIIVAVKNTSTSDNVSILNIKTHNKKFRCASSVRWPVRLLNSP